MRVFDSSAGGLTRLDALVKNDENENETGDNAVRHNDFVNERFIYLTDQVNIPSSNNHSQDKS